MLLLSIESVTRKKKTSSSCMFGLMIISPFFTEGSKLKLSRILWIGQQSIPLIGANHFSVTDHHLAGNPKQESKTSTSISIGYHETAKDELKKACCSLCFTKVSFN